MSVGSPAGDVQAVIRDGEPPPLVDEDGPPVVNAEAETEFFAGAEGEVADDSAIWRNEAIPTLEPNCGFCLGQSADGARTFAVATQEGGVASSSTS